MKNINPILNRTKGEILLELHKLSNKFKVPKIILINVNDWKKTKAKIYSYLKKNLNTKVAIRSSAKNEDNKFESNAGKFKSYLNININNKKLVYNSIEGVIKSYLSNKNHDNQIIVQEMVEDINSSGVIFTKDIETGADYYVINYDDITGKTNTVTAGQGIHSNRILYIYKKNKNQIKSTRFKKLVKLTQSLESFLGTDSLDIEFAINKKLEIFLLQVRQISTSKKWKKKDNLRIETNLNITEKKINKLFLKKKELFGNSTILGSMPDWNPVEIIGKYPSQLSVSLYKYLITDNIWAKARSIMGYKNLEGNKLMHVLCGQPYIDTRLSLNSFLPKKLNSKISKKIVNHGLLLLKKYPFYHDKIEFKISEPSFNFVSKKKIQKMFNNVLKKDEQKFFLKELKDLTIKLIEEEDKFSLKYCSKKILKLNEEYEKFFLDKKDIDIDVLLKKCRDIGTLNFSILARHGFIAKSFLNSLVENNIFTTNHVNLFEQNLNSITSRMLDDSFLVSEKTLSKSVFMRNYGHLRPGTYDLTSKRYDQMKNFKFNNKRLKRDKFNLTKKQINKINYELRTNNFKISAEEFILYLKNSLSLREYSKFIFSKYLSLILEKIAITAKKYGFSRSEITNLDLNFFRKKNYLKFNKQNISKLIDKKIEEKNLNKTIKLPALIIDKSNLRIIPYQVNLPNFITKKKIDGYLIDLNKKQKTYNLKNRIIFTENADPGYDWIFVHKIKALVTKFGGINSHMAIRCSELSIPAVIGCGEQIYSSLIKNDDNHIFIDCSSSLIYSK